MRSLLCCVVLLMAISGFSQEEDRKAREKAYKASNNLTYDANSELADNNFVEAEANYRKAISKSVNIWSIFHTKRYGVRHCMSDTMCALIYVNDACCT